MCEPYIIYLYINFEIYVMGSGASFDDFESKR